MTTFARLTAVALIVVGILIILTGLALGVTGVIRSITSVASTARPPRAGAITGMLVLALIITHGLLVTGAGEGLYLLAGLPRT